MFRQLRDCARARVARPASATGTRVARTAVVWLDAQWVTGCCPDGAFLCGDLAAMVSHTCWPRLVTKLWLLPTRVRGRCKTSGKVKLVRDSGCTRRCTAVRTVLCKDARQMRAAVDSGRNESAQLMCGLSNHGVCRLPWKFTALWRCLGDGRALGTHAPVALERRTIHSDLSVGREESR